LSSLNSNELSSDIIDGARRISRLMLEYGADTNKKDVQGNTCLHRAILADNIEFIRELLKVQHLLLDERNTDDHVPLWFALQRAEQIRT
jgi:ankyrin repeat protein